MNVTCETSSALTRQLGFLGLGSLFLLLLPADLRGQTPTPPPSLCIDWNESGDAAGWLEYVIPDTEKTVGWRSTGGIAGSGYSFSSLATLEAWPAAPAYYYPLYAKAVDHPVNLVATPAVRLSIHGSAGPGNADLKGGSLHVFVGGSETDGYAYYYFKSGMPPDWWESRHVLLTADPADWQLYTAGGLNPPALGDILLLPDQWGLVIVGAGVQPTGTLGFDGLRVARPFATELWDSADSTDGWYYYKEGDIGTPIRRANTGGVGNSGFAWTPLAELLAWPPTGPTALFPLFSYGFAEGAGKVHPINLIAANRVTIYLNPQPPTPSPGGPADLKGGVLGFWVGEWNAADNYAFYRYTRNSLSLAGVPGWVQSQIPVSRDPRDWQLLGGAAPPSETPKGVTEILADPQQWGLGVFGALSSLSGNLGFDSLTVGCPERVVLNLPAGYCWIANNYLKGGNTVQELLPVVRDSTVLYKPTEGGTLTSTYQVSGGGWDNPGLTLWPGDGLVIYSAAPQTIEFNGTQPPHPPSSQARWPDGTYLVGGRSACPNSFEDFTGFGPREGVEVVIPACSVTIPPAPQGQEFRYVAGAWTPSTPMVEPGQAAYVILPTPTAAVLDRFCALSGGERGVALTWLTLVEVQTIGFHLDRQADGGNWKRVTSRLIPARGGDQEPQTYRFDDLDAPAVVGLPYRLVAVDRSGREQVLAQVSVVERTTFRIARRDPGIAFELRGAPRHAVALQRTSDLLGEPWLAVETVQLDAAGTALVLRPLEPRGGTWFYRLAE